MTENKPQPILGISIGSRLTGIAVIKNNKLLAAHSLTLRNRHTKNHTLTIGSYIQQYKILLIVIKTPPVTHITVRIKELLHQCLSLFDNFGCMVEYKDGREVKRAAPSITNKLDIIQFASALYPELVPLANKEIANRQKYHLKMFEAVVIAHLKKQQIQSELKTVPDD